jgi:uncharacterized membrane protein
MANLRKYCMVLYGLYGLSAMLQFSQSTLLISALILMLAYAMTTRRKKAAKDTPFASHLRWMLRTFWIGTSIIFPLAIIIATVLVLTFTDLIPVMAAAAIGNPEAQMNAMQGYMLENMGEISLITMPFMLLSALWWLRRLWVGYVLARNGKPVENVTSWL